MSRARAIEVLCDFDGTISPIDTVDFILERLAEPAWRTLEERWIGGEIDSRECMAGQIALVGGGWAAVVDALARVELDPSFAGFAAWCRGAGIPLRIVSEGIERVILHLLARGRIQVDDVWAPSLVESAEGRLRLEFPIDGATRCGAALCKCAALATVEPRSLTVLIGDGRSDFCAAGRADLVFACSKLAIHCQQNDIPYVPFVGFDGVRRRLADELAALSEGPGDAQGSAAPTDRGRMPRGRSVLPA
jgi:2-hydroxy-3-keto-5-methylthiopentenyl-1-phosphate phosphatase